MSHEYGVHKDLVVCLNHTLTSRIIISEKGVIKQESIERGTLQRGQFLRDGPI